MALNGLKRNHLCTSCRVSMFISLKVIVSRVIKDLIFDYIKVSPLFENLPMKSFNFASSMIRNIKINEVDHILMQIMVLSAKNG